MGNQTPVWLGLGLTQTTGTVQVSGKLPSYPSPKPTLSLTSHLGKNVSLGEGQVVSFSDT